MKKLLKKLNDNATLLSSVQQCEIKITPILLRFITNFPYYTDHTINHSKTVLEYAELLLGDNIKKLNEDEVYILIMAGFLHDIGMSPTTIMKKNIKENPSFKSSGKEFADYLRDVHHEISYQYITTHWKSLNIINETYAEAIALVGLGHRVVNIMDFDIYNPEFPVKSGTDFVCLPFLAGILRLADELDITNDRTPEFLFNEYLPSNKISKREWEKHKANYFVNFKEPTIKITSKCHNKDLYYALLKQYSKIDEVIKYVQKIINTIPENERGFRLDFLKLDKDIKTYGFVPKEIGFTFDLQNTINTFIGDNIYKDRFVAIRECLQNSIDTCRYKKKLSRSTYTPEITINLMNDRLIVSDNGLGMDEFIVENYFSKLAKSYYSETRVTNEYEAISQFGIGVFSYFLLCDYFEVESKQEGKPPVKFRATKDADNYFHFYDNASKDSNGTEITFFLNKELVFDKLIQAVKYYIRFVEFPIKIFFNEKVESIYSEEFSLNKKKFLNDRIDRQHKDSLENIEVVDAKIFNDDCDGILGILISKNHNGTFLPISGYETFGTSNIAVIEVSQKGIFVSNSRDARTSMVIGKINLKRRNNIDIGRYMLRNTEKINSIYEQFYIKIFKKVFKNWKSQDSKSRAELTTKFIVNYFSYESHFKIEFLEKFFNDFFFIIFNGESKESLSITKILKIDELIIVQDEIPFSGHGYYDFHNVNEIYEEVKKSLILQNRGLPAWLLLMIFKNRNAHIEIKCTNKHWYFLIKPKVEAHKQDIFPDQEIEVYSFDKPHICAYTNLLFERPFNANHEIINYYILNNQIISEDEQLKGHFKEFFKVMSSFMYKIHSERFSQKFPMSEINYMNSLLLKINKIKGCDFKLSENDFPSWINKMIKWEKH